MISIVKGKTEISLHHQARSNSSPIQLLALPRGADSCLVLEKFLWLLASTRHDRIFFKWGQHRSCDQAGDECFAL